MQLRPALSLLHVYSSKPLNIIVIWHSKAGKIYSLETRNQVLCQPTNMAWLINQKLLGITDPGFAQPNSWRDIFEEIYLDFISI